MKYNNEKGITLLEVLAVVFIIGLLAIVMVPTINNLVQKEKEKLYYLQLSQLITATKNWVSDNKDKLENLTGVCETANWYKVTLDTLKKSENNTSYLAYDFKNTKTGNLFSNDDTFVYIYKQNDSYIYCVYNSDCTNVNFESYASEASKICCDGQQFKERVNCEIPNNFNMPDFLVSPDGFSTKKNISVLFSQMNGVKLIYSEKGGTLNVNAQECSSVENENYVCDGNLVQAGETIESKKWYLTESNPILTVDDNGYVNAIISDKINYKFNSVTINTIDKSAPLNVDFTVSLNNNTITITASATDNESGILGFKYSLDGGNSWNSSFFDSTSDNTISIGNLESGNYQIKVKASNNVVQNEEEKIGENTTISSKTESIDVN